MLPTGASCVSYLTDTLGYKLSSKTLIETFCNLPWQSIIIAFIIYAATSTLDGQWNFKESSMEDSKCYPGAKVQCHLRFNWECQPRCAPISEGCVQRVLTFDEGYRYGAMTTNISECFNGVLKGARSLPITTMVKYTWFKLNAYFDDCHNKSIA